MGNKNEQLKILCKHGEKEPLHENRHLLALKWPTDLWKKKIAIPILLAITHFHQKQSSGRCGGRRQRTVF